MKNLRCGRDDPFGMAVHDMSLGNVCEKYSDTRMFRRKTDNWPRRKTLVKEIELGGRSSPLSDKNGIINRATTRQIVQFQARKRTSDVHSHHFDTSDADAAGKETEAINTKPKAFSTNSQTHFRFYRETTDVKKQNSPIDKEPASSEPLSPQKSTSNVMVTPMRERKSSQFYGSHSPTKSTPQSNWSSTKSPQFSMSLQKRLCSYNTATILNKKIRLSPNRDEDKENQGDLTEEYDLTEDYDLNKEGFKNLGNTCYMNAGLQALFCSRSFSEDIVSTFNEIKDDLNQNDSFRAISNLFIERNKIFSKYSEDHYEALLTQVKAAIDSSCNNFLGNQMEDAQEFHNKVVHTMKEEISVAIENLNVDLINPVERNLKMTLAETMTCLECGNVVRTSQDAFDIALQVPQTPTGSLQTALEANFAEELREFDCLNCFHNQSKAKTTILCPPRTLTIFLKRYQFSDGQVVKDETCIDVPDYLTLHKFEEKQRLVPLEPNCQSEKLLDCSVATPDAQDPDAQNGGDNLENLKEEADLIEDNQNVIAVDQSYQLTSAVCHLGDANAGHYVCYGIDSDKQRYKLFDDANVSEVSRKVVSSALKEYGYLFIYTRK